MEQTKRMAEKSLFTNHDDKVFLFAEAAKKRVFAVFIYAENNLTLTYAERVFYLIV